MNNKKLGTSFEEEFCKLLKSCGYWVHFMHPSASGSQPCDIIACKNNVPFLIDCKTSVDKVFRMNRLEDNQKLAFYKFKRSGNNNCWVAVRYKEKVYMLDYELLEKFGKLELIDEFLFEEQSFD